MKRVVVPVLTSILASSLALGAGGAAQAEAPPRPARAVAGQVHIIQAVPDDAVTITVDGKAVKRGATVGSVVPLELAPGAHTVAFTGGGMSLTSDLRVRAGSNNDVVLHRPAAVGGDPVIHKYSTPMKPIGPGKARVLIAHTATVAPADVRVDGQVVFTNIANGEYATADVAAGRHRVALLPTGLTKNPILGPVDVTLQPRTVTMVYAVGDPTSDSMQVIAHVVSLRADGSVAPDTIDTGSAGLAAAVDVVPFSATGDQGVATTPWSPLLLTALLALVAAVVGSAARVRRRTHATARG